ncbi:MAG: hypothetical protein A3E78_09925 [Alphaproteobacteria bacterium RIFCSPHIGHO2_12_FULL_63_12]|nr:MAG: hypothetical protein A3E78_09925 [Alphaproteobacteria bacterium RIFCSPHIGHO2_12_FULL_63_12]
MEDLRNIIALGFSGADVTRALIIAFTLAILPRKKRSSWFLGAIALFIDRLIWPISGMALAGADIHSIYASIGALQKTFVDDLGLYVVRYLGLVVMIAGFMAFRNSVNAKLIPPKAKPATA